MIYSITGIPCDSNYLEHHGILGQKWGKRNGPPYPLNAMDRSSAEKKAAKINAQSRNEKVDSRKQRAAKEFTQHMAKRQTAREKYAEAQNKQRKLFDASRAKDMLKYQHELTDETNAAITSVSLFYSDKDRDSLIEYTDKLSELCSEFYDLMESQGADMSDPTEDIEVPDSLLSGMKKNVQAVSKIYGRVVDTVLSAAISDAQYVLSGDEYRKLYNDTVSMLGTQDPNSDAFAIAYDVVKSHEQVK